MAVWNSAEIQVLLVEDDGDDYVLIRDMLTRIPHPKFNLEWASDYETGLEMVVKGKYDVCLLDYQLGERNGLELLREAGLRGGRVPVIFLTGRGDYRIDIEAMEAGAADYLMKEHIAVHVLERSIRYAIDRKQKEEELRNYQLHLEHLVQERTAEAIKARAEAEQRAKELEAAMDALKAGETRYRAIVEDQTEFICRFLPDTSLTFVNEALCRYVGLERETLLGRSVARFILPEDLPRVEERLASLSPGNPIAVLEHRVRLPNGEVHWHRCSTRAIYGGDGKLIEFQAVGQDITEQKKARDELVRIAVTDSLTGVFNRGHLIARFEEEFERSKRSGKELSCILIDIDFFKSINDTYGHLTGDEVLRRVSAKIRESIRIYDILGRYGGEEFLLVLPDTGLKEAIELAFRINESIRTNCIIKLDDQSCLRITVSLGVTSLREADSHTDNLLRRSDEALYYAKDNGRDRIEYMP